MTPCPRDPRPPAGRRGAAKQGREDHCRRRDHRETHRRRAATAFAAFDCATGTSPCPPPFPCPLISCARDLRLERDPFLPFCPARSCAMTNDSVGR